MSVNKDPAPNSVEEFIEKMNIDANLMPHLWTEENRRLADETLELENKLPKYKSDVKDTEERIKHGIVNRDYIQQTVTQTEALVNSKQNSLISEQHMIKIMENERNNLQRRVKALTAELYELSQVQIRDLQDKFFSKKQELCDLEAELKTTTDALQICFDDLMRQNNDNQSIEEYRRQDDARVREVGLTMEKLNETMLQNQRKLDNAITETTVTEYELSRVAELYRSSHDERNALLAQFEESIRRMMQLDAIMRKMSQDLADGRVKEAAITARIKEKERLLETLKKEDVILEKNHADLCYSWSTMKANQTKFKNDVVSFVAEVGQLQRVTQSTARRLEIARGEATETQRDGLTKTAVLEALNDEVKRHRHVLQDLQHKKLSHREMERLGEECWHRALVDQRNMAENFEVRSAKLISLLNKRQKLRDNLMLVDFNLRVLKSAITRAAKDLHNMDENRNRLEELRYNLDFLIHSKQDHILALAGKTASDTEASEINRLQKKLDALKQDNDSMAKCIKDIQSHSRRIQKQLFRIGDQRELVIESKKTVLAIHVRAETDLKKEKRQKQYRTVDKNMNKVIVEVLRRTLLYSSTAVDLLTSERLHMQAVVRDRQAEIAAYQSIIENGLRSFSSQNRKITCRLTERQNDIQHFELRFEYVMRALKRGEDEPLDNSEQGLHANAIGIVEQEVTVINSAYPITTRHALEREVMKCKGEELQAKLAKAEIETIAMSNTLRILSSSNNKTLKPNGIEQCQKCKEAVELRKLEEHLKSFTTIVECKKKEIQGLRGDLEHKKLRLSFMLEEATKIKRHSNVVMSKTDSIQGDVSLYKVELDKTANQVSHFYNKIQMSASAATVVFGHTSDEVDIDVRELTRMNKNANSELANVIRIYPAMADVVNNVMYEDNQEESSTTTQMETPSVEASELGSSEIDAFRLVRSTAATYGSSRSVTPVFDDISISSFNSSVARSMESDMGLSMPSNTCFSQEGSDRLRPYLLVPSRTGHASRTSSIRELPTRVEVEAEREYVDYYVHYDDKLWEKDEKEGDETEGQRVE